MTADTGEYKGLHYQENRKHYWEHQRIGLDVQTPVSEKSLAEIMAENEQIKQERAAYDKAKKAGHFGK